MGKMFIEYVGNNDLSTPFYYPYENDLYFRYLIECAKNYIKLNKKIVEDSIRDEILLQLINSSFATIFGNTVDVLDLYSDKKNNIAIDECAMLTNLYNDCAFEIFNNEKNKDSNITFEQRSLVLLDFLNYVSILNDFDRIFTINDLKAKADIQTKKNEYEDFIDFLTYYSYIISKLNKGISLDKIIKNEFNRMISKDYILDVCLYAYEKSGKKENISDEYKKRIIEMKKR